MKRFASLCVAVLLAGLAFSQSDDPTTEFEAADVHVSPPGTNGIFRRGPNMRGGRYELRGATMVDLVGLAYGLSNDKVLGGPSWLEMDRFDVIAKASAHATVDSCKPALQKLLADRFKLVARSESKPLPAYALVVGKKPLLKEADGKEDAGCKAQSGNPGPNGGMFVTMGADGKAQQFTLGPGGTIQYQCRNMTMDAFASGLRGMFAAGLTGSSPVKNETNLEGKWNFDVKWSIGMIRGTDADQITIFDAMEKQLGLKLDRRQVPTPVVTVESVNQKPTDNVSDIADRLKVPPPPTEFEVAALKPVDPNDRPMMMMPYQMQAGGRVSIQYQSVKGLIMSAWNLRPEMVIGAASWMDSDRYDILGKVATNEQLDLEQVWPAVRKLLTERFQMTVHMEERPVNAYTLVSVKPKMTKADPNSRSHIQNGPPPDGKDPRPPNTMRSRLLICQNISMAQLAGQLQMLAGGYFQSPVLDATGLEGGWDFTLSFSPNGMADRMARGGRMGGGDGPGGGTAGGVGEAADPGDAISLFEAVEKQLGLKLEQQKRPAQVLMIDKAERKPLDN